MLGDPLKLSEAHPNLKLRKIGWIYWDLSSKDQGKELQARRFILLHPHLLRATCHVARCGIELKTTPLRAKHTNHSTTDLADWFVRAVREIEQLGVNNSPIQNPENCNIISNGL